MATDQSPPASPAAGSPTPHDRPPGSARPGSLGLTALTALVIGSMIGGGIFDLPANMAGSAAPGPLVIGWLITGAGMLMLAFVFQRLAEQRPDIDGGVYGYARAGLGDYVGFTSAWGYWISAWIGNVAYLVLLMSTLGYFFPALINDSGNLTLAALILASLLVWAIHLLVLRGVRNAALTNTVVTIAKVVPLAVFIVVAAASFKAGIFTADFWGQVTEIPGDEGPMTLGSTMAQVKNMMLVTVWVFIGIEGASVYSARAAKRSDVGKATVLGFVGVLVLLLLVNLLSYGVMAQADIAGLSEPSMAGVLKHLVGPWGAAFVSIGLIVSLLGALLAWVLLCAEILYVPARQGVVPRWLGANNAAGSPAGALWLTNACIQVLLIVSYFRAGTYLELVYLATSLILLPYLWSAIYHVVVAVKDGTAPGAGLPARDLLIGGVAVVYSLWLLYAGGLGYLLMAAIAFLIGTPLYVMARKETGKPLFTSKEYAVLGVLALASLYAIATQAWEGLL